MHNSIVPARKPDVVVCSQHDHKQVWSEEVDQSEVSSSSRASGNPKVVPLATHRNATHFPLNSFLCTSRKQRRMGASLYYSHIFNIIVTARVRVVNWTRLSKCCALIYTGSIEKAYHMGGSHRVWRVYSIIWATHPPILPHQICHTRSWSITALLSMCTTQNGASWKTNPRCEGVYCTE